jgi:hypothetical protein
MSATGSKLAAGCIASLDPLVTVSKREPHLPLGIAPSRPDLFADRTGLHLVGLTWSCEPEDVIVELARDYAVAAKALPRAKIVVMASTAHESYVLSREGVPNLLANELIFIDERQFTVLPPQPLSSARFDAIYVARLDAMKRHELAVAVPNLVLAHGQPSPGDAARVRQLLPKARFANFEANGGAYGYLRDEDIVALMNRSAVGLCLSAVEGAMRASMEYRLCGTPVVSTRSVGGRDRYFLGPHVRVVDDHPDAVAAGVRELKAMNLSRLAVREFIGGLVSFDRHSFLLALNKLVAHELGVHNRFRSFAPFIRYPSSWRTPEQILAPLTAQLPTA